MYPTRPGRTVSSHSTLLNMIRANTEPLRTIIIVCISVIFCGPHSGAYSVSYPGLLVKFVTK